MAELLTVGDVARRIGAPRAMSVGLKNLPKVKLDRLPRMADFARWMTAAEPGLGWAAGTFMRAYDGNREDANSLAIEASAVGPAILAMMGSRPEWTGTAGEMLRDLDDSVDDRTKNRREWPKSSRAMVGKLKRIVPNLRALGLEVEELPRTKSRRPMRVWWKGSSPPSPSSPAAFAGPRDGFLGDGAGDGRACSHGPGIGPDGTETHIGDSDDRGDDLFADSHE